MQLTNEQIAIADSTAKVLVVEAGAGCAKTSTLIEYAKRRPGIRMIYLAFNASVKAEAAGKFPRNVKCMTTHGIAFRGFGSRYQHKLGNLRATQVTRLIGLDDVVSAGRVIDTVRAYCCSADEKIMVRHALHSLPAGAENQADALVHYANRLWELMQDPANSAVPMTHDGYLKLFQLSRPRIDTGVILLDEAQDANPVTLDIIAMQRHATKVYVGDSFQAIYGFRGAVDAIAGIKDATRLRLSGSFRFGEGIASLATALLKDWRRVDFPIKGFGRQASVFSVDPAKTHAFLARSNGSIFKAAVDVMRENRPYLFVGGVDGYRFDLILDVYHLMVGDLPGVRDAYIKSFGDFATLEKYADEMDDRELKSMINVVAGYGSEIPVLIPQIKAGALQFTTTLGVPQQVLDAGLVSFSTVHKAKGLEWDDVILADDFADLEVKEDKSGQPEYPDPEEIHILYVAMTRAKRGLELPGGVKKWLRESGRFSMLDGTLDTLAAGMAPPSSAPEQPELPLSNPEPEQPVPSQGVRRNLKLVPTRLIEDEQNEEIRQTRVIEKGNALFEQVVSLTEELETHFRQHMPELGGDLAKWFASRSRAFQQIKDASDAEDDVPAEA